MDRQVHVQRLLFEIEINAGRVGGGGRDRLRREVAPRSAGEHFINMPAHQYNFPNPFNLIDKSVTLRAGTSGVASNIRGTYIVIAPTGSGSEDIKLRIYNVAGDLVREFKPTLTRGQYNYIEWDGRNTAGDDVASGVYFAAVDAAGAPKRTPIKMVLVK